MTPDQPPQKNTHESHSDAHLRKMAQEAIAAGQARIKARQARLRPAFDPPPIERVDLNLPKAKTATRAQSADAMRQYERIADLIKEGKTNKEIAEEMQIPSYAVANTRYRIKRGDYERGAA